VELGGGPHAHLGRDIGKRLEDVTLDLGKPGEGALVGGAVGAVSGRGDDPVLELAVGVGQRTELA
jgi:hypothetical protein